MEIFGILVKETDQRIYKTSLYTAAFESLLQTIWVTISPGYGGFQVLFFFSF